MRARLFLSLARISTNLGKEHKLPDKRVPRSSRGERWRNHAMQHVLVHQHSAPGSWLHEQPRAAGRLKEKSLRIPLLSPMRIEVDQQADEERLPCGAIGVLAVMIVPSRRRQCTRICINTANATRNR